MKKNGENPARLRPLEHEQSSLGLADFARYQLCVSAGAAAALTFFEEITTVGLHDHIAVSMHAFLSPFRAPASASESIPPNILQRYTDAFAAGYLGRIHQELRSIRGEGGSTHERNLHGRPH